MNEHHNFFDINKFPKDWGIIGFPISMSRIANAQSPQSCITDLEFLTQKIQTNQVGANFIYTEGVYMNLDHNAYETKNKLARTAVSHMRGVRKLISKNFQKFQIEDAFSFESWFQMYLSHKDFFKALKEVEELYETDTTFQKLIHQDAKDQGRELTKYQLSFYLEEHTFAYLALHRQLTLRNEFVKGREEWVLFVYPGSPLKGQRGQIYLFQKYPLKLGIDTNPYKGQYDLLERKFIPYLEVDLENY